MTAEGGAASALQSEVECVWPVGAELGEGAFWSVPEQALWFVDIKGRAIHRYHEPSGERRSWSAPQQPAFILPAAGGGFVCGLQSGLHRFDPDTGTFTLLHAVEPHLPHNRLNDGCVDPEGFLWFGSMDDGEREASGSIYRLTAQGCERHDSGYIIPNGPAASPDGRMLYYTATVAKDIYACARARGGALSARRLFVHVAVEDAHPDGPTVDAEGCLWTALFGGWGLQRYAPDGRLLQTVRLPCANVTKPALGGSDLRTMYVTTAWKSLNAAQRAQQPLAGGLFRVRVATPGVAHSPVAHGL